MNTTHEAVVDEQGNVTLLKGITLASPHKAIVTILADANLTAPDRPAEPIPVPNGQSDLAAELRAVAIHNGAYLTNEQLSREHMYD